MKMPDYDWECVIQSSDRLRVRCTDWYLRKSQHEDEILAGERPTNDENINSSTSRAVKSVNEVSISGGSADHSILANPRETPRGVGSRAFK